MNGVSLIRSRGGNEVEKLISIPTLALRPQEYLMKNVDEVYTRALVVEQLSLYVEM